jgi:hypothetical protein
MSYQKNLHTNRIVTTGNQDAWTHVTLNSRFYPARHKFSMDSGVYSVACVEITPRDRGAGRSAIVTKPDVLHFRNATGVDGLREEITKSFPQAIFSSTAPQQIDPIRAAYEEQRENQPADAREIANAWEKLRQQYGNRNEHGVKELIPGTRFTEEDCRKIGIRRGVYLALSGQAEREGNELLTKAARQYVAEQTPEQQERLLGSQLQDFVNNGEWGWAAWLQARPRFFQWPDNKSGWNRTQLLAYCRAHGSGVVPTHLELATGMKYLLEHGNFFALKSSYKRSERFEFDALQEYRGDEYVVPTFSDSQIVEATQRLRKALPVGSVPSQERIEGTARELGISEELLYAIQHPGEQPNKAQVAGKSSAELKRDLQAMRPPVDPADRRKGY